MKTEDNTIVSAQCPDCATHNLPCCRHCGRCGRIVHAWLPEGVYCVHKHEGYKSEGGHLFCPDCGKPLAPERTTSIVSRKLVATISRDELKKIQTENPPPKKEWMFVEFNKCPGCQSANFSRLFGGKFNKKCDECGKAFEENTSPIGHLTRY